MNYSERAVLLKQTWRMIRFMDLEGIERSEEILERAEEEFMTVKWTNVKQETKKIDAAFNKHIAEFTKLLGSEQSVLHQRMKIILQREKRNNVDGVLHDIVSIVEYQMKKEKFYLAVLEKLLIQALYMILIPVVQVRTRRQDWPHMKEIFHRVADEAADVFKFQVTLILDTENPLPDSSLGGVELVSPSLRQKVSNTIAARVANIIFKAMPLIRAMLYGPNPRRTFFD